MEFGEVVRCTRRRGFGEAVWNILQIAMGRSDAEEFLQE